MTSSFRNIFLILALVILLPVCMFIIFQIGSVTDDEKMLELAYRKQLESVIFSMNTYAGDLFSSYVNQIEMHFAKTEGKELVDSTFVQHNLAIRAIVARGKWGLVRWDDGDEMSLNFDSLFQVNEYLYQRLIQYKSANYVKPESVAELHEFDRKQHVSLVILGQDIPCFIVFDPVDFIESLLAPRMSQLSGQNLNILMRYRNSGNVVFSDVEGDPDLIQSGELWLMPEYELSVSLRGESIRDLIAYRSRQNIIALVSLILLLGVGITLVIRNLRREMQLSKAKADFVANVSHEIRTPLALISMFNETLMLGRVTDDSRRQEYYDIIHKEANRLKNIVNKILNFSQIDADKKQYHISSIRPNQEIQQIINSYSYHLHEKGFEFTHILGDFELTLQADPEAFAEVFINLLDNAIKYSLDTKKISIESSVRDGFYELAVTDQGIGIEKSKQAHVFDKFYRVTDGDRHQTKGTGLGLSLVKNIVQAHGGRVEVESVFGKGSTFRVYFPLRA
jgi:two-component system, OmpR family, phosphate regulon sensor histidine kinase PhoR